MSGLPLSHSGSGTLDVVHKTYGEPCVCTLPDAMSTLLTLLELKFTKKRKSQDSTDDENIYNVGREMQKRKKKLKRPTGADSKHRSAQRHQRHENNGKQQRFPVWVGTVAMYLLRIFPCENKYTKEKQT